MVSAVFSTTPFSSSYYFLLSTEVGRELIALTSGKALYPFGRLSQPCYQGYFPDPGSSTWHGNVSAFGRLA